MTRSSETLHFAVPGALDQPTGGYRYGLRIVSALRAAGRPVTVHELAGRFPEADDAARAAARACLDATEDATLVIDGLALPAFEGHLPARARAIALIHHPLALETGISEADHLLAWYHGGGIKIGQTHADRDLDLPAARRNGGGPDSLAHSRRHGQGIGG